MFPLITVWNGCVSLLFTSDLNVSTDNSIGEVPACSLRLKTFNFDLSKVQKHVRFLPGSAEQGCGLISSATDTICHVFSLGPFFPRQQTHESLGVLAQLTPGAVHHLFLPRDWNRDKKWEIPEGKNCRSLTTWLVPCGTACAETQVPGVRLGRTAWTYMVWKLEKGTASG